MNGCDVCLGTSDYDFTWDFYRSATVTARKGHKCSECGREIAVGDRYEYVSAHVDGAMFFYHTCLDCVDLRDSLSCKEDGLTICHGMLWEEIRDLLFPAMNIHCLEKIHTASAKSLVVQRWREWKFKERRAGA